MYLCSRLSFLCSWEDGHHEKMLTLFPLLRKLLDVPAQGMGSLQSTSHDACWGAGLSLSRAFLTPGGIFKYIDYIHGGFHT